MSATELITRFREIADAHEVGDLVSFGRKLAVGRALVASEDPDAIAEWLCSARREHPWTGPGGRCGPFGDHPLDLRMRGLVTRGGSGTGFPADNPWGIPPDADVERAIRHVWAPVADVAPATLAQMVERVFAVALVAHDDGDSLAYLYGGAPPEGSLWSTAAVARLLGPHVTGGPEICWGDTPRAVSERDVAEALGTPVPARLCQLSAIHRSLRFTVAEGWVDTDGLRRYDGWFRENRDGEDLGRYVVFAGHQDGDFVVDRGRLATSGEVVVLAHDCNDGLDPTAGVPFWTWFDGEIPLYFTDY